MSQAQVPPTEPSATAAPARRSSRDPVIDAIRGMCVAQMIAAHFGKNTVLYSATYFPALVDSPNGFFFLAGFVLSRVHLRRVLKVPESQACLQVAQRGFGLYAIHLALLVAYLVAGTLTGAWFWLRFPPDTTLDLGTVWQGAVLRFQPRFFDILPLYIVFLPLAALLLPLLRRGGGPSILLASSLLYLLAQLSPAWVEAEYSWWGQHHWSYAAWQIVFVLGLVMGAWKREEFESFARRFFPIAVGLTIAFLLFSQLRRLDHIWMPAKIIIEAVEPLFAKPTNGPGRMVYFFVFFMAGYWWLTANWHRPWLRTVLQPFELVGSRTLRVFVAHLIVLLPLLLVGFEWWHPIAREATVLLGLALMYFVAIPNWGEEPSKPRPAPTTSSSAADSASAGS